MKTSLNGIGLITDFEGFESKPYLDIVGVPTIGYGSTRYPSGKRVTINDPAISEGQAIALLQATLVEYENGVNQLAKVPLTQNQFDALTSFAYNLGVTAFASSTLLKKLNAKDYVGAANEFPKWNKAGGKVVAGLTRRRLAEQKLFKE
jgi:GH24 family phage-related lysozyme (muramidase)